MEIDHEIFSLVIILPLIQEGLLSVTIKSVGRILLTAYFKLAQEKSVVRFTDHLHMTIAVD